MTDLIPDKFKRRHEVRPEMRKWQEKYAIRTDLTPKAFEKEFLQPVSASYCMAKWLEATMWLYLGETASCHHNPTHKIVLDPNDPKTLHNTPQKIHERERMIKGEKPDGCSYCWNAEEFNQTSDRMVKSRSYNSHLIATTLEEVETVVPKRLEIAFSRTCNLACAYCGPKFSSTWALDIKKNGPYDIVGNNRFEDDFKANIIKEEDNPYIQAFFDWWPELEKTLLTMRFTGGEPLLHIKFWEFLDLIDGSLDYKGKLIVNSNMIHEKGQVEKFISKTKWIWANKWNPPGRESNGVEIHTSCESSLAQAEYIRDGFVGSTWMRNIRTVLDTSNISVTITTAISNATIWSYVDYLRMVNDLKEEYGVNRVHMNANRVHHPEFYQIQLLPKHYRIELAEEIEECMEKEFHNLKDEQCKIAIDNLTDFLRNSEWRKMHTQKFVIESDHVKFFDQYAKRRNKTNEGLDPRYLEWVDYLRNNRLV